MKLVIFAILLVIASSQVTTLCPGFKNAGTCFNTAFGSGITNPAFDGCIAYTNPKECSACGSGLKVNTSKSCDYDVSYFQYTYFPHADTDYKNCVNYNEQYAAHIADLTKIPYTSLSCIDSNKQLLCRCKPGFVFLTSTLKCSACGTNCLTCKSDATSTCYTCAGGYYLGTTNACAQCTTNALTCATAAKAASCVSGYYLKADDGTCVSCPSNSTCTSATVFTCNAGYYNASGTCTLCGNNAALCTGVTSASASTNITECVKPDATNIYYLTSKGCQAVLASNYCLTVSDTAVSGTFKCDTCLYGYYNSQGICYSCYSGSFTDVTATAELPYTAIINVCTQGTQSTKATATCKDGYIWNTAGGTFGNCQTCAAQNGTTAGMTGCAKCSSLTTCDTCGAGYAKKTTNLCLACSDAAVCKVCTLDTDAFSQCTEFINNTKASDTGVAKGALTAIASITTNSVANCATGVYWKATVGQWAGLANALDAAKYPKCLTCTSGVLYTHFTTGKSICEATVISPYTNFVGCSLASHVADTTTPAVTDFKCTTCAAGYRINGAAFVCQQCTDTTDCLKCDGAAGTCTSCKNNKVVNTTAGTCVAGVTNCKADTATIQSQYGGWNGTAATCSLCDTTTVYYLKNAAGTSCLSCDGVKAHCKTLAVDTACGCTECNSGYYLTGTAGTYTCSNTTPSNCGYFETDGKVATCFFCNPGYRWNASATPPACAACSTTLVCATVADTCSTLNYPGKPSAAAAAAANSSIISLVLSLLLALITLLI